MNKCLWCGKPISNVAKYCKRVKGEEDCGYSHRRSLALAGKIPPTRMLICPVCDNEYPYYAVLSNWHTCSTTSGSDCSEKRKNNNLAKTKRAKTVPKHHLHESCRQHPLCVNFNICQPAGFPDHKKDGSCYSAPLQRGSIDSSSIHAYHPSCFG